jgi:hypothetical protein
MHHTLARIAAFLGVKVITRADGIPVAESTLSPQLQNLIDSRDEYEDDLIKHQKNVYLYDGESNSDYILKERRMMEDTTRLLVSTNAEIRALLEEQNLTERETADPSEPVFDETIDRPNGTAVRKVRYQDGSGTDELYGIDDIRTHIFKIHPDGTREEI